MTAQQYILDFPVLSSHSTEDFVIGQCNQVAAEMINKWPNWPGHALIIIGEAGSGKTHLANIFREKAAATLVKASDLRDEDIPKLTDNVVIEDANGGVDETALFHLFNWTRDHKGFLLITARTGPEKWGLELKDLISRLKASPVARLENPDEDVLAAAMAKQFSDRQIIVEDRVISFLIKRMDRSFQALQQIVQEMDQLSLQEKARITVPLARKIMGDIG